MSPPPHAELLHTFLALSLVAILSLSGILTFVLGSRLQNALPFLVGAAAGALLGICFAHLIPESVEKAGTGLQFSVSLTAGLLGSFLLERLLSGVLQHEDHLSPGIPPPRSEYLHHTHEISRSTGAPLIANILFGGAIHSFIDGVAIATGFTASHQLGIAATVAVLLHEVPHHVADVGILIFGGLSKVKAVLWNALAGCTCLLGGAVVFLLGHYVSNLSAYLLPITAGNFLYIATAILIPELQKEKNTWRSTEQIFCLVGGIVLMFGLSHLIRG